MATPSSSNAKTGRPRGRRAAPRVPCDACIARATKENEEGASLELCESCRATLHRPRKKPQEQTSSKRIRRQSNAIIDTALGVRTDPVDVPRSSNPEEQHSLDFFIQHSSRQLAGYFDSPFWQRTVLRAGRHEPAVRHAIAAIGALHEKLLAGAADPNEHRNRRTEFALEQCNKAIQLLVKPANPKAKPDLQLMLTTSVLFTLFEALQGNCNQAIVHASQGYNLLQKYASDPNNSRWAVGTFAVELDQLCLLMRRLQTQSENPNSSNASLIFDLSAIDTVRPIVSHTLQDARHSLEVVLNQLTVFFLDAELDDEFYGLALSSAERQTTFAPWLAEWEVLFTAYLSQHQATMSAGDRHAAMVLKAHHLVAEILANVDLNLEERAWDAFHRKFTAIVDLATEVLQDNRGTDTSRIETRWKADHGVVSTPNATLSFSLGIVDPLYEVCARCRDRNLRRRALDLLANHPRQECVWSSWSAWKVGKHLMHLQEHGDSAQVVQNLEEPASPASWSDVSTASLEGVPMEKSHSKGALPRATARYQLNPGLFEVLLSNAISPSVPLPTASLEGVPMEKSHSKGALPRATARYQLNPGLFEEWAPPLDTGAQRPLSIVHPGISTASTADMTMAENNAALAAASPVDLEPIWFDFEGLQHIDEVLSIQDRHQNV